MSNNSKVIYARTWTDDLNYVVDFDAEPWARNAPFLALLDLVGCGFRGDYPSDRVAQAAEEYDPEVAKLFEYLQLVPKQSNGQDNGFECLVDPDDFWEWVEKNKTPEEVRALRRAEKHEDR